MGAFSQRKTVTLKRLLLMALSDIRRNIAIRPKLGELRKWLDRARNDVHDPKRFSLWRCIKMPPRRLVRSGSGSLHCLAQVQ